MNGPTAAALDGVAELAGPVEEGQPGAASHTMSHFGRGHASGLRHFHAQVGLSQEVVHSCFCYIVQQEGGRGAGYAS